MTSKRISVLISLVLMFIIPSLAWGSKIPAAFSEVSIYIGFVFYIATLVCAWITWKDNDVDPNKDKYCWLMLAFAVIGCFFTWATLSNLKFGCITC